MFSFNNNLFYTNLEWHMSYVEKNGMCVFKTSFDQTQLTFVCYCNYRLIYTRRRFQIYQILLQLINRDNGVGSSLRSRRFPFCAGCGKETPAQMAMKKAFFSDKTSDLIPIGQSR